MFSFDVNNGLSVDSVFKAFEINKSLILSCFYYVSTMLLSIPSVSFNTKCQTS